MMFGKGKVIITCCRCKTKYTFAKGVKAYRKNKTDNQEKVLLWLQKKGMQGLMIRCPKCGLVHLVTIFVFDNFFEKVFLVNTKSEQKKVLEA